MDTTDVTTHVRPDLDAIVGVYIYALKEGLDFPSVTIHFVPAGQNGPGVNIDTGGGEWDHHRNDKPNECAASLLWQSLPEGEIKEAVEDLVTFTKRQDLSGSPFPRGTCVNVAEHTEQPLPHDLQTIGTLLSVSIAFQESDRTDLEIIQAFWPILDALKDLRLKQIRAEVQYESQATQVTENVVFIRNSTNSLSRIAFQRGVRAVIFSSVFPEAFDGNDGYGFGIVRRNDLDVDLVQLQAWSGFDEEREDWFFHQAGFLACNGSTKSPRKNISKVSPQKLAEQFELLLAQA